MTPASKAEDSDPVNSVGMLDPPGLATVKLVTGKSGDDEFEAMHRDLTEAATTPGCTFADDPRVPVTWRAGRWIPKSSAVGQCRTNTEW